jgi:N-acyl-D-amino-acid deacylase
MQKLLIRGGTIVDGSGRRPFQGEVAIEGDLITEVAEKLDGTGRTVIDAGGLMVAPGFIDLHTHTDRKIFENPLGDSKILQGVTTEVVANCGVGPFPVRAARRRELEEYLNTLEGSLPPEGITWTDCDGFIAAVEKRRPGINLAMLVAHGALRIAAMGSGDRPPSTEELQDMRQMLDQSLRQGAWGMSTGLIYPPGSFAATQELIALAKVLAAQRALYTSHVRNESIRLLDSIEEAISVGRESGARVLISHLKAIGRPYWGNGLEALYRIEKARREGIEIWADQYPYEATATALSALVPGWVHDGGVQALVKRLDDESLREKINAGIRYEMNIRGGPDRVRIAVVRSAANQMWMGKTILELAAAKSLLPEEAVRQLLLEENAGVNAIYFSLGEQDLQGILQSPDVAVGSDGQVMNAVRDKDKSVHPRSYGTFPRVLGRYVREKQWLPLETAIRKMTALPAAILGMQDRGVIQPGYKADITIFDAATVNDRADFNNPHQYPVGIRQVLVNGTIAVATEGLTGYGKGEVLRKKTF